MWMRIQTVFLQAQRSRLPSLVDNSFGKNVASANSSLLTRPPVAQQIHQTSAFSTSAGTGSCSSLGAIGSFKSTSGSNCFLRPWATSNPEESLVSSHTLNQVTAYVPSRGMKIKGRVNRRCKDCVLIWEEGILYNRCATHPRHKQMLKQQYWPNLRIVTHGTASPRPPWRYPANGVNRRSSI